MPSGAKKRKAAKKRKEKEANTSTAQSLGDDDLKIHGEKESDGGEGSSPLSQGHHNHKDGEAEKREDTSSARSFVTENKFVKGVESEGASTQGAEIKEGKIVDIDGNSEFKDDPGNKNFSVEFIESVEKSHDSSSSEEGGSSSSNSSSSDDEGRVVEKNIVAMEPAEPKSHAVEGSLFDNYVTSAAVESVSNQNGVTVLPPGKESSGISSNLMELESQQKEDTLTASGKSDAAPSDAMGLTAQESEDKLLLSFNAPRSDTTYGAEDLKDLSSQPLLASEPHPVQRTSWKSCCGLFEVLSGSSR